MAEYAKELQDLIERLGNLLRADVRVSCHASGVRPVQLEALNFLTQCNHYSDTPQAVADYLGLTKGTVSQTLKVLEEKGLLRKQGDSNDKRVVHLKPTARGRRLVGRAVPAGLLTSGIEQLPETELRDTLNALRGLLHSVQKANHLRTFAPCYSCRFNTKRESGYFCELTQESLAESEIALLCREHQFPKVSHVAKKTTKA